MRTDERILHEQDADLTLLQARVVAVIGYGNQGRAQALNLRDSGCRVIVGARVNRDSAAAAHSDGFEVFDIREASQKADVIALLLPDQFHRSVYRESIAPALTAGQLLLFGHGFSVHYGLIDLPSDIDVALVAPVGPGRLLRELYVKGFGIPALLAVEQNITGQARELALAYAAALGCARVGVLPSTFEEETETDLFGEQAVLCGGLAGLIRTGFETLVEAGYRPELAYFECVHQVKLIADLIYESGIAGMNRAISDTAEFGEYIAGPQVIGEESAAGMRSVLHDIRDGTFARLWMEDVDSGNPVLRERRLAKESHPMEEVGERLRAMTHTDS